MAENTFTTNNNPHLNTRSNADNLSTVYLWSDPTTHELLVKASVTPASGTTQDVNITKVSGTTFSLGQQLAANSLPIVLTATQLATLTPLSTVTAGKKMATTGTPTSVAASVTTVTILASNTNRVSADIANDSTALLYLKKGSGASTTNWTYLLNPSTATAAGGLAIIDDYNGIITGVWASASGNARVTENV